MNSMRAKRNRNETKRSATFYMNLHEIANKYLSRTYICAGIVIVIAWPKAFRNKLSGLTLAQTLALALIAVNMS